MVKSLLLFIGSPRRRTRRMPQKMGLISLFQWFFASQTPRYMVTKWERYHLRHYTPDQYYKECSGSPHKLEKFLCWVLPSQVFNNMERAWQALIKWLLTLDTCENNAYMDQKRCAERKKRQKKQRSDPQQWHTYYLNNRQSPLVLLVQHTSYVKSMTSTNTPGFCSCFTFLLLCSVSFVLCECCSPRTGS